MKNVKRFLTLFLLLGLMLSVAVFAGEKDAPGTISEIKVETDYAENVETEVIESGRGAYESFKLTYSDAADGGMYLVLVQSETGVPTGENILYVNQVTAGEDPEVDGAYFKNVYPSEIVYEEVKDEEGNNYSYIYLSGTNLPRELVGTIIPNVEVPADDLTVIPYGVGDDVYSVDGRVVTVEYELACKLGYEKADGSYAAIKAVSNGDGSYNFTVDEGISEVVLVVKGDVTKTGTLMPADAVQVKAAQLGKLVFDELKLFAADVAVDGTLMPADAVQVKAAQLGKLKLAW